MPTWPCIALTFAEHKLSVLLFCQSVQSACHIISYIPCDLVYRKIQTIVQTSRAKLQSLQTLQNAFYKKHFASSLVVTKHSIMLITTAPVHCTPTLKWGALCKCKGITALYKQSVHAKGNVPGGLKQSMQKHSTIHTTNNVHCLIPANNLVTVAKLRLNHPFKSVQGPHDKVLNGHCHTSPTTGKALQHHHHLHTRRQMSSHV